MSMSAGWKAAFPGLWFSCLSGWWTIAGITVFLFHLPQVQITIDSLNSVSFRTVSLLLSQWQSCFAVRDWSNCSPDAFITLRRLFRLTMQWKMNQIRNFYNGKFEFEIYNKTTILIILYIIKGNGIRELINCLTYSWRVPFNSIYFCFISI